MIAHTRECLDGRKKVVAFTFLKAGHGPTPCGICDVFKFHMYGLFFRKPVSFDAVLVVPEEFGVGVASRGVVIISRCEFQRGCTLTTLRGART